MALGRLALPNIVARAEGHGGLVTICISSHDYFHQETFLPRGAIPRQKWQVLRSPLC